MAKKEIKRYCDTQYCVMVPVYYENEPRPSWRIVFKGTSEECKKELSLFPDFLNATFEENAENRNNMRKEYLFYLSIGKTKKAEKIKLQYGF